MKLMSTGTAGGAAGAVHAVMQRSMSPDHSSATIMVEQHTTMMKSMNIGTSSCVADLAIARTSSPAPS